METYYVILKENDVRRGVYETLFWSNEIGWVDFESADRFTLEDACRLNLPIGGVWVTVTPAMERLLSC